MSQSHRMEFLEQQMTVMQREISEVLGELQQTILAITKTNQVFQAVVHERLVALENSLATTSLAVETRTDGVEL